MMIKFNDRFEFYRDKYQWILTENVRGMDKNGMVKITPRKTFHGTLRQVIGVIIDKEVGNCEDLEQIIDLLSNAESILADRLTNRW